eukprot:3650896-Rhodomonas_salina.1
MPPAHCHVKRRVSILHTARAGRRVARERAMEKEVGGIRRERTETSAQGCLTSHDAKTQAGGFLETSADDCTETQTQTQTKPHRLTASTTSFSGMSCELWFCFSASSSKYCATW